MSASPVPFGGGVGGGASPYHGRPPAPPHRNPSPEGEGLKAFATNAHRLAGIAGALFGWRPADFWAATPAELETVLSALAGPDGATPPPAATIASLKERFPDG